MNPSFFNRRKKDAEQEKPKKKWQIDEESDDQDDLDQSESLTCIVCRGEPDVQCTECDSYMCLEHFEQKHPLDVSEEGVKAESAMSRHKFRVLVGVAENKFDDMMVGWNVEEELSRFEQAKLRVERKRKREEEEEEERKRMKEEELREEEEEEKRRQEEEEEKQKQGNGSNPLSDLELLDSMRDADDIFRVVIVSNISFEAGEDELRPFLAKAGTIIDFQFVQHPEAVKKPHMLHNGSARVEFESVKGAAFALGMHGTDFHGRPLRVLTVRQSVSGAASSSSRSVPYKVKMCQHMLSGQCRKGDSCSFAHHPRELPGGGKVHLPPNAPGHKHGVDGGFRW
eukprot:83382-Hanusia_phi.AAC.1